MHILHIAFRSLRQKSVTYRNEAELKLSSPNQSVSV